LEVIKKSIQLLKQDQALIMFPEGTRSSDGQLKDGKIGVGMLAHKAGVPIVPVYLKNTRKAWLNLLIGKRMLIIFGEPISADWIRSCSGTKEGYRMITDKLMQKLGELQDIAFES
jgi:1-acyl-sn-glycerol-3-phosphate acyltransferase